MPADLISSAAPATQDALELLRADHRRIRALFADCEQLSDQAGAQVHADRSGLIARLGALLHAHLLMEFDVFYPALRLDSEQLADARAERADILADLEGLARDDASGHMQAMDKRLAALADKVEAHIDENEVHLFPQAKGADLQALGTRLAQRRGELLGDQGAD